MWVIFYRIAVPYTKDCWSAIAYPEWMYDEVRKWVDSQPVGYAEIIVRYM